MKLNVKYTDCKTSGIDKSHRAYVNKEKDQRAKIKTTITQDCRRSLVTDQENKQEQQEQQEQQENQEIDQEIDQETTNPTMRDLIRNFTVYVKPDSPDSNSQRK